MAAFHTSSVRLISSLPVFVTALTSGIWSDRYDRKLPILLLMTGVAFGQLLLILASCLAYGSLALLLAGAAVIGLSGQIDCIRLCILVYSADCSTKEKRTLKVTLLIGSSFLGKFVASLLLSLILHFASFSMLFLTSIVITTVTFIITVLFFEDICKDNKVENTVKDVSQVEDIKPLCSFKVLGKCFPKSISNDPRSIMYLLCTYTSILILTLNTSGSNDALVLFSKRPELSWSDSTYGFFRATTFACNALFSLLSISSMIGYTGISDLMLIYIGLAACLIRYIILSLSLTTLTVFLSSIVFGAGTLALSGYTAFASKLVEHNEQGKVLAILTMFQLLGDALGTPIYCSIYAAYVETFPRIIFVIMGATAVVLLVLCSLFALDLKRNLRCTLCICNIESDEKQQLHIAK